MTIPTSLPRPAEPPRCPACTLATDLACNCSEADSELTFDAHAPWAQEVLNRTAVCFDVSPKAVRRRMAGQ